MTDISCPVLEFWIIAKNLKYIIDILAETSN